MANTVVQPPVADVTAITDPVYAYESDNGFFSAEFASTIGTDNAVLFTTNGYTFGWKPQNVIYVDSAGNMDVIFGVNAQATAQVYKNRVTYVGTSQLTTDIFECQENQLKHTIQMVAPPRLPAGYIGTPVQMASGGVITYDSSLQVFADGQVQKTDFEVIGDIGFKDADGNLIYKLPMITVEDANGNTAQGTYKVTFNADGTISFYGMVPWDFLQTAVYPVVIDPTVIVSSSYDTSGNGGRKVVRLSNNWIVSVALNTSTWVIYFYVSKDNGQTWTQLCYSGNVTSSTLDASRIAIASTGTTVYCLTPISSTNVGFIAFDATTVTNAAQGFKSTTVDQGLNGFGAGASLLVDGNGKIWAAITAKTATYTNWNIRIVSSTDGGATWSAASLLTNSSAANIYHTYPCLVIRSNNYPTVMWLNTNTTSGATQTVYANPWNGSAWAGNYTIANINGGYAQSWLNGLADGNDVIHAFWCGLDSSNTALQQIKYSKSSDGGSTWSSWVNLTNVTSGQPQIRPSASVDTNNNIYLLYMGSDATITTTYNIMKLVCTNGTWGSPVRLTSETTGSGCDDPQTIWSKFNMNSSDATRYTYRDQTTSQVLYDSITYNSPPNAPILTAHANFDATTPQTLAWTFSDPDSGNTQSAYELQIVDTSNNNVVVDTGKVASTVSSYSLAVNTLTNGKQYQWRVTTWDNSGAQGPYSAYGTFSTAAAPSVIITAPTANQVIPSSSETVQFSYSDPANNAQQSYEVMLYDSTGNTLIEDSGVINGTNNQYTLQTVLANNTTYVAKVKATNSKGVTSATMSQTFSTSFTAPATPTVTVTPQSSHAAIALTNPAPSGSQPTVAYNDLHRRNAGGSEADWVRIATNLANNATFNDYGVASGQAYDYKVTANGNNQTTSDSTVSTNNSVALPAGLSLHDVSDPAGTILTLPFFEQSGGGGQTPNTEQWTPTATEMQFSGRKYPVVEFGEAESFQVTRGNVAIIQDEATWNSLTSLLRNQTTLCFRDTRGRIVYGNVTVGYQETDLRFGRQVTIQVTQTDYSIVV